MNVGADSSAMGACDNTQHHAPQGSPMNRLLQKSRCHNLHSPFELYP
jgi:hypothetical protein